MLHAAAVMAHRGPDAQGLWGFMPQSPNVAFAHRRLAVVDLDERANQPLVVRRNEGQVEHGSGDVQGVLVYNGELYNDGDIRKELLAHGASFTMRSDTQTVAYALAQWKHEALARLRGMYSLAWYDARNQRVLLARDPLGIKPLFYTVTRVGGVRGAKVVGFASEAHAAAGMLTDSPRPDLCTVSSYLTTIRTTLGSRTLFQDVYTLRPGQALEFDLMDEDLEPRDVSADVQTLAKYHARDEGVSIAEVMRESIRVHQVSDVPLCGLLSGGLDSSIVCAVMNEARDQRDGEQIRTYCAGGRRAGGKQAAGGLGDEEQDLAYAAQMSTFLGTKHTELEIDECGFVAEWADMVTRLGTPLSTPNEVAIRGIARALRRDGQVVALSGEGADELFGGYGLAMNAAHRHSHDAQGVSGGRFALADASWIPVEVKKAIVNEQVLGQMEFDEVLVHEYESQFQLAQGEAGSLQPDAGRAERDVLAHMLLMQRINLSGLLARLDTAMMLEGVEGRTPFADVVVAMKANTMKLDEKYTMHDPGDGFGNTKRALRKAFATKLPARVVTREKASFPLPFQDWVGQVVRVLNESHFAREIFTQAASVTVASNPREYWRLAWPMLNVAMWGKRWWG